MLKRCSATVLLSVLLATAANAQCAGVGQQLASAYRQWQSTQSSNSQAEKEYSTCMKSQAQEHCNSQPGNQAQYAACVEDQARAANQARSQNQPPEHCKDEYSKLQSAQHDLETAVSEYEGWRGNDCVQQSGGYFGRTQRMGVWPPAR
jgi:hypothetical protein